MKPKRPRTNPYETINRLVALKHLLRGAGCTRAEILDALPEYGDDPQFQKLRRDLGALEALGDRVERNELDKRYRVIPAPPEVDWSEDELQTLAMIRELFREEMYGAEAVRAALTRLEKGMLPAQARVYQRTPPIAVSLQATPHYETFAVILHRLEKALNKQHVAFEYQPPDKETTVRHRDVLPCALEFRDGHYYSRYAERTRSDRIDGSDYVARRTGLRVPNVAYATCKAPT